MNEPNSVSRRTVLAGALAVAAATAIPLSPAAARPARTTLSGVVRSGTRSLPRVKVTVQALGRHAPTTVGHGTTDSSGAFTVEIRPARTSSLLLVQAELGRRVVLAAVVSTGHDGALVVNELTTVAVGFAFAQFMRRGEIRGTALALSIAAGMQDNLVDIATGAPSSVLLSSPNADQTVALRTLRSLGNALAAVVRGRGPGGRRLLDHAGRGGHDTLQALAAIARTPQRDPAPLFALSREVVVYEPALLAVPDAWTLAVKVHDTGDPNLLMGGPANIAFDDRGYAWITNNVVQGTPNSSTFNIVLQPNGRPSDGTNGTPLSPLTGGGILGAGFGVAVGPDGRAWFGNFGWGGSDYQPSPSGTGSIATFAPDGTPLSGPTGTQGGVDRAQGIVVDDDGNVWIASYGNDRLYVFPGGDPTTPVYHQLPSKACPFDVALAHDGSVWLTCSGGLNSGADGALGRFRFDGTSVQEIWYQQLGHSLKGLDLDSLGNAWIASGGDDCVYLVNPAGTVLGSFSAGGIDTPWSVQVDGDDHVWVANFGKEAANVNYNRASITRLAGANRATRPKGMATGDPLCPAAGFTLASAGDPVLLADGSPLYGPSAPPAFTPLQRMTNTCIDRAGNVWALNNWKPSFDADLVNPGGDGIVIFIGLAAPVR